MKKRIVCYGDSNTCFETNSQTSPDVIDGYFAKRSSYKEKSGEIAADIPTTTPQ